jgi:hypothetical protein|tara:strand:+ start:110 stop:514 length:405 start_codon:yes stop_codon:yes gene_type:complete
MKNFLKKLTGLDKEEARIAKEKARVEQDSLEVLQKKDPKAYATKKKQPWVNVLDMQVNKDNIRNGFFELDWNKYFIKDLIRNGYGEEADPEEEIVDRWFRDIVYNMLDEEGMDTSRGAGYINVVPIAKGKSEVS